MTFFILIFPIRLLAIIPAENPFIQRTIDNYATKIFRESAATGMVMVVIDGENRFFTGLGETRPGSGIKPKKNSLVRIASLSKLMTSEVMLKMALQGKIKLEDPLSKFAPPDSRVPTYQGHQIRLLDLSTHTSGLPREQPGGKPIRPVFIWPTKDDRWRWLKENPLKIWPGSQAIYSNLGYDLLADALSRAAGLPYTTLFHRLITHPLGMKDTTFKPTEEQCRRLMIPKQKLSPCVTTLAAIGSGGLYSTPIDMGKWMQQFLHSQKKPRKYQAQRLQTFIYLRNQLTGVKGFDVAGKADALGMGWVYMSPRGNLPGIIQKTGGGGGFITYMAMIPERNVGVFVAVTRTSKTRFKSMSDGANALIGELAGRKWISGVTTASK